MEITKELKENNCDITLTGKFTFNDHTAFRDILEQLGKPDIKQLVLYMSRVESVDSAALGMLLLAHDEAKKHQKTLIVSGVTGQVEKMFNVTRFNTLFTLR